MTEESSSAWRSRLERTVDERREKLKHERSLAGKIEKINSQVERWEKELQQQQQKQGKGKGSESQSEEAKHAKKKRTPKVKQDESIQKQIQQDREAEASKETRNTLITLRKALSTSDETWRQLEATWNQNPWLQSTTKTIPETGNNEDVIRLIIPNYKRKRKTVEQELESEDDRKWAEEQYRIVQTILGKGHAFFDSQTKKPKRRFSTQRTSAKEREPLLKESVRDTHTRRQRSFSFSYFRPNNSSRPMIPIQTLKEDPFARMPLGEVLLLLRTQNIVENMQDGILPREMPVEKPSIGTASKELFINRFARRSLDKVLRRRQILEDVKGRMDKLDNMGTLLREEMRLESHLESAHGDTEWKGDSTLRVPAVDANIRKQHFEEQGHHQDTSTMSLRAKSAGQLFQLNLLGTSEVGELAARVQSAPMKDNNETSNAQELANERFWPPSGRSFEVSPWGGGSVQGQSSRLYNDDLNSDDEGGN